MSNGPLRTPEGNPISDETLATWRGLAGPAWSGEAQHALLVAYDDGFNEGFDAADESRLDCEEGA